MDQIELLEGVLTKTGKVVADVAQPRLASATPCDDYTVQQLMDHIVGWVQVFEAGCNGRTFEGDPSAYVGGPDAADEFARLAASLVAGWKEYGFDREVQISSGSMMPATMVFNMTVMEYMAHGWDLASATGQPNPYSEAEAAEVLARAKTTLPPEYQGEGMAFGAVVPVAADAPAIDQLIGFLGRDPKWAESPTG
ncbi:MAG TPA: TIGR03086 family metal-binding protein [Acidimicrobiales bacterium]|nr:TIGR03086 family metal-binding protein [Acidimicrobiales bacterium]